MHPLLSGRQSIFYAVAWLPVAGLLVLFLRQSGEFSFAESLLMALALSGLFAMVCLSAWYLCRLTPLSTGSFPRLFVTPMIAAIMAATIWVGMARLLTAVLSGQTSFAGLDTRMARSETWLWATGVLLYLLAISFSYLLVELESAREAKTREVRAAMMAREAELKALRDQVSPHFLFNSLNSISALVGADKQRAREMCALLGDFLRMSLGIGEKRFIPLREELALVRHYLAIEQVRFSDRLVLEEQIEEAALDVPIPPLLLQPLVENAVKHGVGQMTERGTIRIEAKVVGNELQMQVTNPFDPEAPKRKGQGLGLENVRRRMQSIYGGGARLDIFSSDGRFRAGIHMWTQPPEGSR